MLTSLVRFSLTYRAVVLVLAAVLVVGGAEAVRQAPWDVFPEFAPPQIVVQTVATGLSAEQVERLVTVPIESVVNGVHRLHILRSSSAPGLSVVTAIFEAGTDVLAARQLVTERLAEASALLPRGVEQPRLMPWTASTSRFLMIGLTSDEVSPLDLRTLAEWTISRRLRAVPGVAHVEVFGGAVKQYQVLVRPEELQSHRLALDEVVQAAQRATGIGGAGFVETANQRLSIRQWARVESAAEIATTPVGFDRGAPLTLGQVADVRVGAADRYGDALINGRPGVLLVLHKQPQHNTLAVTEAVQHLLGELRPTLPPGVVVHPELFRQAAFIERSIGNLTETILIGSALVALVLVVFLMQWRTVVISLTAIPLSLLGAIVVLRLFDITLNTMTLGGLAIAVGEVVDDAIVDVENVVRRLREARASGSQSSAYQIVLSASLEVRSAVVFATFIVMLVFLPVFCLDGLAGSFFRPLATAYVVSTLVSLLVALTVTPAMCLLLLPGAQVDERREPRVALWLKGLYAWMLPGCLTRGRAVLAGAALSVLVAIGVLPLLGGELLPEFREANFVILMVGRADTSLAETQRVGALLAQRLLERPGVKSVAQQIGRANLSEDTWGPNISEIWVALDPQASVPAIAAELREDLESFPGYAFQVKQFLRERIDEVLTGSTADVAVRVVGPDLAVLRDRANQIAALAQPIAGAVDVRVEPIVEVPQVEVSLRPAEASLYGLSVGALNSAVQTLLGGTVVGQVYEGEAVFDVVVRAATEVRDDPRTIGRLLIDTPTQGRIPLHAVTSVSLQATPNLINRENSTRRILVSCNVAGRDVVSLVDELRQRVTQEISLPKSGYHLEFAGEAEARSAATRRLLLVTAVSLLGIWLLLYFDFGSPRLATLILLSVPLACVGGVLAMAAEDGEVSLGSLVGLVSVFGIAVRNGILLVAHYQTLRVEYGPLDTELLTRGAAERLTPILMTTATTALGLAPLILAGDQPGSEIEYPMAVVICGGLLSSALLTLFVVPVLYARFAPVGAPPETGA